MALPYYMEHNRPIPDTIYLCPRCKRSVAETADWFVVRKCYVCGNDEPGIPYQKEATMVSTFPGERL